MVWEDKSLDAKFINPFLIAFTGVMPQVGFVNIVRGKICSKEQFVDSLGVSVQVGVKSQSDGNIVFNMSEQTAKKISSVMMMGTVINTIDDMAKSAVCEVFNMVVSHASTSLNKEGFMVKVNPPIFLQDNTKIQVCNSTYIAIEMIVDNCPVEMSIGLNAG
jgi:chemotaxis protein CheX